MAEEKSGGIVNVMKEERLFPPPAEFAAKARVRSMEEYEKLYQEAAEDLEGFYELFPELRLEHEILDDLVREQNEADEALLRQTKPSE